MPPNPYEARIRPRNDRKIQPGDYVLYWMQQSQRAEDNHALEYAVALANGHQKPLVVVFGLTGDYPEANLRHYRFMLEGLAETQETLAKRGILLSIRPGSPPDVALKAAQNACCLVCDRGYLRHQRSWRRQVASRSPCPVFEVESDVVVPVQAVSDKAEYAARTIRPKIHRHLDRFLCSVPTNEPQTGSTSLPPEGVDLSDIDRVVAQMNIDKSVAPATGFFRGGTKEAKRRFDVFLTQHLDRYAENSNQPQSDDVSGMSPYLHFGQISPLYLAMNSSSAGSWPSTSSITTTAMTDTTACRSGPKRPFPSTGKTNGNTSTTKTPWRRRKPTTPIGTPP